MLVVCVMLAAIWISDTGEEAIKEFNKRVEQYWDIHKRIADAAPSVDDEKEKPQAIIAHERALATGIRAARANAVEGEIFTPAVQKVFTETIRQAISLGGRKETRDVILGEGNPRNPESRAAVDLQVNAKYPSNAPLSTVPPSVLLSLPKLPEGLEYRFVGRHLILYDSKANLIVDILRNAIR